MRQKMKLIIEVDKKYYEACKDAVKEPYPSQIEEIIANGTPYNPTGDAISREALKEAISSTIAQATEIGIMADANYLWGLLNYAIDNAPTVEARPQGEWIKIDEEWYDYKCSVCGEKVRRLYPFCHCGAEMKGGAE